MNDLHAFLAHTRWPGRTLRVAMQLAVVVVTASMLGANLAAAQGKAGSIVDVHRDQFHDACFVGSVASTVETASEIDVRLAIKHERSSGHCGCKSAALKANVYAVAEPSTVANGSLVGMKLIQTTVAFSNTLETFEFVIKNRRLARGYRIWLTCAS